MAEKLMKVQRIEHGTVIDHILPGMAFDVLRVIDVSPDKTMSILINSHSSKGGTKDILKVEDIELSEDEASRVALVSPDATINIIENGKVTLKFQAQAPDVVRGILTCPNPNCISNDNEPIMSQFTREPNKELRYVCSYCERDIVDLVKRIR